MKIRKEYDLTDPNEESAAPTAAEIKICTHGLRGNQKNGNGISIQGVGPSTHPNALSRKRKPETKASSENADSATISQSRPQATPSSAIERSERQVRSKYNLVESKFKAAKWYRGAYRPKIQGVYFPRESYLHH